MKLISMVFLIGLIFSYVFQTNKDDFGVPYSSEDFIKVSHHFGRKKNIYPIHYTPRFNKGLEVILTQGADIFAVHDGRVVSICDTCSTGPGKIITIRHNEHTLVSYYHLSQINVEPGSNVTKGQLIGVSGSTGITTVNGLGISVELHNELVDPEGFIDFNLEE